MKCTQCQFEWTPPPGECPQCQAMRASTQVRPPSSQYNVPSQRVSVTYQQEYVAAPQTSGMAIAALILGMLSCIPLCGLVALILGIVALVQIGNSRGRLAGQGMAIAGIICSIMLTICLLVFAGPLLFAGLAIPIFSKANEKSDQTNCLSNQRQIAMAAMLYAQDNNQKLPSGFTSLNLSPSVLTCKDSSNPIGYGYNSNLAGSALGSINSTDQPKILLSADSNAPNHLITSSTDIDSTRHKSGYIASFVDGHVEFCPQEKQVVIQPHSLPTP